MHRFILLALGLAAVWVASRAGAADDDKTDQKKKAIARLLNATPEQFIKRFDKNGDGFLQEDELPPRLAEAFARLDKNGDGKLDKQEVADMLKLLRERLANADPTKKKTSEPEKKPAEPEKKVNDGDVESAVNRLLERLDKNKDGKISRDEAMGPVADAFDRLDTNKDGFLDREELKRAAARMLANQRGGGFRLPGGPARPDFDALDKNADGRLSRDEVKDSPLDKLFDEIDTNKDGKINRKEFDAYYRKQAAAPEKAEEKKDTKKKK